MKKIVELKKTSPACPEQYDGLLDTGERIYLRVRSGIAELRTGSEQQWQDWTMDTVARNEDPDKLLGTFGPGVLADLFRKAGITCEINMDKLETPHKSLEEMIEDAKKWQGEDCEKLILTFDMDIIHGKSDMFKNVKDDQFIELSPEQLKDLAEAAAGKFPDAK